MSKTNHVVGHVWPQKLQGDHVHVWRRRGTFGMDPNDPRYRFWYCAGCPATKQKQSIKGNAPRRGIVNVERGLN